MITLFKDGTWRQMPDAEAAAAQHTDPAWLVNIPESTPFGDAAEQFVNEPKAEQETPAEQHKPAGIMCYWCGHPHDGRMCPRVRTITIDLIFGKPVRYDFWPDPQYPADSGATPSGYKGQ